MTSEPGSEDRPADHPEGNQAATVNHPVVRAAMARHLRHSPAMAHHRSDPVHMVARHRRRVVMGNHRHHKGATVNRPHRRLATARRPSKAGMDNLRLPHRLRAMARRRNVRVAMVRRPRPHNPASVSLRVATALLHRNRVPMARRLRPILVAPPPVPPPLMSANCSPASGSETSLPLAEGFCSGSPNTSRKSPLR